MKNHNWTSLAGALVGAVAGLAGLGLYEWYSRAEPADPVVPLSSSLADVLADLVSDLESGAEDLPARIADTTVVLLAYLDMGGLQADGSELVIPLVESGQKIGRLRLHVPNEHGAPFHSFEFQLVPGERYDDLRADESELTISLACSNETVTAVSVVAQTLVHRSEDAFERLNTPAPFVVGGTYRADTMSEESGRILLRTWTDEDTDEPMWSTSADVQWTRAGDISRHSAFETFALSLKSVTG